MTATTLGFHPATAAPRSLKPSAPHRLPRVARIARRSAILHPNPPGDDPNVLSLNILQGCVHRCPFCSVRGHAAYPGDETVYLFQDTPDLLDRELLSRRHPPRAVYISPSTDPFPPIYEIQDATARAVNILSAHEIESWLMTRGYIRPSIVKQLANHASIVKVIIGLTTLDRTLQRMLEPLAAPPQLRLRQIKQLKAVGIKVEVAMEPLVPGLTDSRTNFVAVLDALKRAGVNHVTAGYMFLRSGIADNLSSALAEEGLADSVLEEFHHGPILTSGHIAAARYLPKVRRQHGYAALIALAAERGMTVSVSSTTNPDFVPPKRVPQPLAYRQRVFPAFSLLRN